MSGLGAVPPQGGPRHAARGSGAAAGDQAVPDQAALDQAVPDHSGPDHSRQDQAVSGKSATDRAAPDKAGPDRSARSDSSGRRSGGGSTRDFDPASVDEAGFGGRPNGGRTQSQRPERRGREDVSTPGSRSNGPRGADSRISRDDRRDQDIRRDRDHADDRVDRVDRDDSFADLRDLVRPRGGGYPSWGEHELAAALRSSVEPLGAGGPPTAGPDRIRLAVRARQRNRNILAGTAGAVVVAIAVVVAGSTHLRVPQIGADGPGGAVAAGPSGAGALGSGAYPAGRSASIVYPSPGDRRRGPAIGPVDQVTTLPSTARSDYPLCTDTTLDTTIVIGPTIEGVVYARVDATAQTPCTAVGPPTLSVTNQAGTAASSVVLLKESLDAAPELPEVGTWGTTLELAAGQTLEFQFAWLPLPCLPQTAAAAAGASDTGPTPPVPTSGPAVSGYSVGYLAGGSTVPAPVASLRATCGADVFVTDIYPQGTEPYPTAGSDTPPPSASEPASPSPEQTAASGGSSPSPTGAGAGGSTGGSPSPSATGQADATQASQSAGPGGAGATGGSG